LFAVLGLLLQLYQNFVIELSRYTVIRSIQINTAYIVCL